MKNIHFFHFISSFESTSYKKIQLPVFLFLSAFTSTYIIFYIFLPLHSTLSEKTFSAQIFTFLIDSLQPSNLLNGENSLNMTKVSFYLLFGCPLPTFGHCRGDSLVNTMLITAFSLLCLEGH